MQLERACGLFDHGEGSAKDRSLTGVGYHRLLDRVNRRLEEIFSVSDEEQAQAAADLTAWFASLRGENYDPAIQNPYWRDRETGFRTPQLRSGSIGLTIVGGEAVAPIPSRTWFNKLADVATFVGALAFGARLAPGLMQGKQSLAERPVHKDLHPDLKPHVAEAAGAGHSQVSDVAASELGHAVDAIPDHQPDPTPEFEGRQILPTPTVCVTSPPDGQLSPPWLYQGFEISGDDSPTFLFPPAYTDILGRGFFDLPADQSTGFWGYGSGWPGGPTEHWAAQFVGRVWFPSGRTLFSGYVDDGIRLKIITKGEAQLVFDHWDGFTGWVYDIPWDNSDDEGGWHWMIVDFNEVVGDAVLELTWRPFCDEGQPVVIPTGTVIPPTPTSTQIGPTPSPEVTPTGTPTPEEETVFLPLIARDKP